MYLGGSQGTIPLIITRRLQGPFSHSREGALDWSTDSSSLYPGSQPPANEYVIMDKIIQALGFTNDPYGVPR